jgi:predicted GNAT family N-acyltransferase
MKIGAAVRDADRQACFAIRRAVFIEEQRIPEAEEWDGHDATCIHFLAVADGAPAGTARLIATGDIAKIGRVAVMKAHRGTGLGRRIMQTVLDHARHAGFGSAQLDAQVTVLGFYESLGFCAHGPEFDDGSGILHRRMTLDLAAVADSRTRAVSGAG